MSKISTDEQAPRRNTINMRKTRKDRLNRRGVRCSGIDFLPLVRGNGDEKQDDGVCDQSIFSFSTASDCENRSA